MRTFILYCFIAAVAADISGYNYNRQTSGHRQDGSSVLSGIIQPNFQQQLVQQVPQVGQQAAQVIQQVPQAVEEVNKEFYTYSAPEEDFHEPQVEQQLSSVTKKNIQVVFIHAPEQAGLNRAVQNLAQQTLEQQTAIYVLTKQADLSNLANTLQRESNSVSHKPEVHFIKYRTQEDAARAQQSIRAQYDALGGSSSNNDGGVAPVINFASQQQSSPTQSGGGGGSIGNIDTNGGHSSIAIASGSIPSIGGIGGTQQIIAPSQNYLPIRF